jgi:hypothetical protein
MLSNKAINNKIIKLVKALYDFSGEGDDELSFQANDIISVTDVSDSGWWSGFDKNGKLGLFPCNYVIDHNPQN